LGRRTFDRRTVHAHSAAHQLWNYTTISTPLVKTGKEKMMIRKQLALLLLFLSPLMPQSQAEIKHVEMRVEGMT
jgi:hypothetical protein